MFKKENGITLVALVVTIIVLLILAGVSITMVLGENGIATKAKKAGKATNIGNAQDAINLAVSEAQADYYENFASDATNADPAYTYKDIQDHLNGYTLCSNASGTALTDEQLAAAVASEAKYIKEGDSSSTSTALKVTFTVSTTDGNNIKSATVTEK